MKNIWFGIAVVIVTILGITFYAPISETFKGFVSVPSFTALIAVLFQLVRDNRILGILGILGTPTMLTFTLNISVVRTNLVEEALSTGNSGLWIG